MKRTHLNQKNIMTPIVNIKNPMGKGYQLSISVSILFLLSLLLLSCTDKKKEVPRSVIQPTVEAFHKTNEATASTQNYEIAPNEKVCMVNDRFMGVSQIPIDVNGTTYYGCCENCVEKLQKNLGDVRFGSNPLNDTKVDKASAIIVQDKNNGSVFYFASQEDAQLFINKNKG